jgi:hypothetical protein
MAIPQKIREKIAKRRQFQLEIEAVIVKYNCEAGSNTPPHILSEVCLLALENFDQCVNLREINYGRETLTGNNL